MAEAQHFPVSVKRISSPSRSSAIACAWKLDWYTNILSMEEVSPLEGELRWVISFEIHLAVWHWGYHVIRGLSLRRGFGKSNIMSQQHRNHKRFNSQASRALLRQADSSNGGRIDAPRECTWTFRTTHPTSWEFLIRFIEYPVSSIWSNSQRTQKIIPRGYGTRDLEELYHRSERCCRIAYWFYSTQPQGFLEGNTLVGTSFGLICNENF